MRRILALLVVVAISACERAPDLVAPDPGLSAPSYSLSAVAQDATPGQLAVAQVVPGFGGYFIDEAGTPTVYLTDPSQRPAAEQALAGFLASFGWTAADLQVRQAGYDYLQLDAWYRNAWPKALAVSGAVLSHIDESSNRLRFGGIDVAAVSGIASTLAQLGVPSAATVVEVTGPVLQVASLRDKVRPVHGGYQINFFASPVSPVGYVCTLGFNAVHHGVNSFITNSHCTNVQGGTDLRTDYYQATRGLIANPDNYIGFEADDPTYFTGNECPLGRWCRYSDAARVQYGAGQVFTLGKVARTAIRNPGTVNGNDDASVLAVHATSPTYSITGEQPSPVLGQTLHKVGRTTGWTGGTVSATCVNVNITASEITQLCQSLVDAFVAGGDSGSPVWGEYTDGSIYLAGILWGSSTNTVTGQVRFIFSPLEAVKRELGGFQTFEASDDDDDGKNRKPKKEKKVK